MTDANIVSTFLAVAGRRGARPFLMEGDRCVLAYADLDRETGRMAARLRALGAATGDRIVVQVDKSPQAVVLYLAAVRAGLVFVPLNTAYTADELAYFVGNADPAVVVCRPEDAAALAGIVAASGRARLATLGADGSGSLLDEMPDEIAPLAPRRAGDLACILYTSGTTGRSKGAMLTHGNLMSNARTLRDLWGWTPDDVLVHVLPIYHVHGLFVALHGALLVGATVLFHRGFDPRAAIADFTRASMMMGVPTHYTRLLAEPGLTRETCHAMRLFVSGSAPLLAETHRQFTDRTGHAILERYGMTETGMITSNPLEGDRVPGTVGFPLPGVEVRIASPEGQVAAAGTPGVLEVRGPNVFAGYWQMPEKTAEEFRPDRFFITGDIATQDGDGRVTLVGRAKDLIISGGLNIYPKEIEEAIDVIPGVEESAVIGVPHADFGEGVVAVVVAGPDAAADLPETIRQGLEGRLARFKQPRAIVLVPALPRNAMGKVQKAALRESCKDMFAATPG